jgi:integrase/recombinase XerC
MLRTLSAPQTPRPESEKLIKLKIIQLQVGHECDSSTAIYTHVSDDFMNTALRKALAPAFEDPARHRKEQ